jgi:predicted nucleic-acid-binding Zn-ribbon protein
MKHSEKCPKCDCTELTHVEDVLDRGMLDTEHSMTLGTRKSLFKGRHGGELEAFACTGCGYVEFYVKEVSDLE